MRVVACVVTLLLVVPVGLSSDARAVPRRKACRVGCRDAIDACVVAGGKRARCKRLTLKSCRKEGVETCTVTTSTVAPTTTAVATTTLPTTTLPSVNGCTTADAVDRRKPTDDRSVEFGAYFYAPRCIRIAAGESVTFTATTDGGFADYPLVGGTVVGDQATPDPQSPIAAVSDGTIADVMFPSVGVFPYYCDPYGVPLHMEGVVFVDPASP